MSKLHRNQEAKAKTESWLLSPKPNIGSLIFYVLIFLLPTQLGIHFWPQYSFVRGLRIDYLSPVVYVTDLLIIALFIFWLLENLHTVSRLFKKYKHAPSQLRPSVFMGYLKFFFNISRSHPLRLALLLIAVYLLIKSFFAPSPLLSLYGLLKFLELAFLGYYVATRTKTAINFKIVALLFSVSLIIQSLLAFSQYLNQGSLNGIFYFLGERKFSASTPGIANASVNGSLILRPYATFPHPNVLAGFLLTGIILIYTFLTVRKNPLLMILKFMALTLGSIALMLTLSRTAIVLWLALITYLFINLILKQKPVEKRIGYFISVILMTFLILLFFNLPIFPRIASSSLLENSVTARRELADTALKAIVDSPLYGIGHYHFLLFRGATAPSAGGFASIQPVHNIFLLVTAENGLIGLFLFVYIFITTFKHLIKNKNPYKTSLLLILTVIIALGLFDHYWLTVQQGQLLLALFLGLAWAM